MVPLRGFTCGGKSSRGPQAAMGATAGMYIFARCATSHFLHVIVEKNYLPQAMGRRVVIERSMARVALI